MKTFVTLAAVALAAFATPALAGDFTGPRIEATAGYQDVTGNRTNLTYGANAGYDVKLVGPVRAGVEVGLDNVFDRRNINVGARLGVKLCDRILAYGKVSYANYRDINFNNIDGARFGGGFELKVAGPVYTKAEYRHDDFGGTKANAGFAGVGLRF